MCVSKNKIKKLFLIIKNLPYKLVLHMQLNQSTITKSTKSIYLLKFIHIFDDIFQYRNKSCRSHKT